MVTRKATARKEAARKPGRSSNASSGKRVLPARYADEHDDDDDDDDDDAPRRRRRGSKKSAPPEGWQNIALWGRSGRGNYAYTGHVKISLAFIDKLLDAIEEGEIDVTEYEGNEYIQLAMVLRDNDSETDKAPELIGSVFIGDKEEKKPARRRRRSR